MVSLLGVFSLSSGGQRLEVWLPLCLSLGLDHIWTEQILNKRNQ